MKSSTTGHSVAILAAAETQASNYSFTIPQDAPAEHLYIQTPKVLRLFPGFERLKQLKESANVQPDSTFREHVKDFTRATASTAASKAWASDLSRVSKSSNWFNKVRSQLAQNA